MLIILISTRYVHKTTTSGHKLLTFIYTFSRYNQIRMTLKDKKYTFFITDRGRYFYRVMLFRLKNIGATYKKNGEQDIQALYWNEHQSVCI